MRSVRGYYYNGKRSVRHLVSIKRQGDFVLIDGVGVDLQFSLNALQFIPRVGGGRQSIRLPGGGLCELLDNLPPDFAPEKTITGSVHRVIDKWERSVVLALLALIMTVAVIAGFIRYGMPVIARQVAFAVPQGSESSLGRDSLAFLDRYLMKPTKLPEEKQQEVQQLFAGMKKRLPEAGWYRLELRSAKTIGANAFALPGGVLVVTDAMVELVESSEGLIGVLAHEAAHIRSRHALRQALQSTGTGILIAAITGDIASITSLSATLPTALIDAGYSRDFEYEADDAAVAYLRAAGIQPKVYADTLARLQSEHDKRTETKGEKRKWSPLGLFSTHPETPERIRRVLGTA